ncbi:MAG: hypothetical protein ACOX79_07330 [Methanosarcina sp.]
MNRCRIRSRKSNTTRKGNLKVKHKGEDYEKMYKPVKNMGDRFPVKALVVMKITEIYGCKPGEQSPERNCFDPVQSLIHKLANK